jgi:limonene-1,2-epoxide hydrolase
MARDTTEATRRKFLALTGVGVAATFATAAPVVAAEPTAAERTNMKAVTDFCLAFAAHDPDRIMSFFADPCSYRVLETRDPIKGFAAVRDQIRDLTKNVERFEILDTFARGPMVFNERIDHFKPGGSIPLRSWHGVGVFFLKAGKIAEWQDFTISTQRS